MVYRSGCPWSCWISRHLWANQQPHWLQWVLAQAWAACFLNFWESGESGESGRCPSCTSDDGLDMIGPYWDHIGPIPLAGAPLSKRNAGVSVLGCAIAMVAVGGCAQAGYGWDKVIMSFQFFAEVTNYEDDAVLIRTCASTCITGSTCIICQYVCFMYLSM